MLPDYGVLTTAGTRFASVEGPALMHASDVVVPGDASSAAFLCVAAILKRGSAIKIDGVSLNPSRIGFVRTLERMGANISESRASVEGKEPIGTISAEYTPVLRGCEIPPQHFASVIDEVPVLALAAARAKGVTVFKGAGELRAKETDRIAAIIEGLGQLGVDAWCEGEDLFIEGDPDLVVPEGLVLDSHGDHRFAMTWALAGLCFDTSVTVKNYESCAVSYPNFLSDIQALAK
jgi:3-phosphoshikimate 1-carboxyvinyltransferase